MKIKQGTSRQQLQFSSLDDLIATDNRVRIIDAFVDKPSLSRIGIPQRSKNGMIIFYRSIAGQTSPAENRKTSMK